jgi:hypothetical protein
VESVRPLDASNALKSSRTGVVVVGTVRFRPQGEGHWPSSALTTFPDQTRLHEPPNRDRGNPARACTLTRSGVLMNPRVTGEKRFRC